MREFVSLPNSLISLGLFWLATVYYQIFIISFLLVAILKIFRLFVVFFVLLFVGLKFLSR